MATGLRPSSSAFSPLTMARKRLYHEALANKTPLLRAAATCVLGLALFGASCGDGPTDPDGPLPGGTVSGRYTIQITPSGSCSFRGPFTFPMNAAQYAAVGSRQGVQLVLDGGTPSSLEAEFLYVSSTMRGGLGAGQFGAVSNQGQRLWIRVIATGPVTHTGNAAGEVTAGMAMGYMAIGANEDDEGAGGTGICNAMDHTFTLRVR
jgi:hypothetical protein